MAEHERTQMRRVVVDALRALDAISVENGARLGTPDVNCTLGWIELKYVESWPARPATPLAVDHFSPQQRAWIARRARLGGFVCVVLKVGREWLILDGAWAALCLGKVDKSRLVGAAVGYWGTFNKREFKECLKNFSSERPSFRESVSA
jgi:hypothetical protein